MAILPETKLAIYNGALRHLGSRSIASLTENREPRRVLDGIWGAASNAVRYALGRGEWNFAIRSVEGIYSPSIQPPFGFRRAYDKPADMVRLAALAPSETFRPALTNDQYMDEAGYWFTDSDVLFIRYVSDDGDYGFNSSLWPENFKLYLELYLAHSACERITNSTSLKDRMQRDMDLMLTQAKSLDAMGEGIKFLPSGGWARSRSRGWRV